MTQPVYTTYCIKDPDTGQVVYVGQTQDFEKRRASHLTLRTRPNIGSVNIRTWLFDMLSAGKMPVIEVLEECADHRTSLASETAWVTRFAAEGKGGAILNKWREHKTALKHGADAWKAARRRAMPSAHGRRWTEESLAELRQLVAAGEPVARIARRLRRTPAAINIQIERLGLTPAALPRPLFVVRLDVRSLFNLLGQDRTAAL